MPIKNYLKSLQTKLLDLTYRNRLLNFKYNSKSSLRVINEVPHNLFEKLKNEVVLTFVPIPEPKAEDFIDELVKVKDEDELNLEKEITKKSRPSVREYAEKLGLNPSFELLLKKDSGSAKAFIDNDIQTMLYPDDLERTLTKIYSLAKSAIDETGNNLLHLAFGTLEYAESDISQETRSSPLVLFPVEITKAKPQDGQPYYSFQISSSGEGPTANISLIQKLRSDFGINIPSANFENSEDDEVSVESVDTYFSLIADTLKQTKPFWKVKVEVTLCILNFGKLALHSDLDPANWTGSKLSDHPIIKNLILGQFENSCDVGFTFAEDHSIDKIFPKMLPRLVYDADSSQHSAMVDVFARKSLVIEGPPGTGKSQTITNIIAAAIGEGKNVLFIAEKLAALQVVKKRLDEAGLGDFCLELHSTKIQKKSVLDSLKRRLAAVFPAPREIEQTRSNLDNAKSRINDYVRTIQMIPRGVKETYSQCIGKFAHLKMELETLNFENLDSVDLKTEIPEEFDHLKFDNDLDKVKEYAHLNYILKERYGSSERHPWSLLGLLSKPKIRSHSLIKKVEQVYHSLNQLEELSNSLDYRHYGLTKDSFYLFLDLYLQVHIDTKSVRANFSSNSIRILSKVSLVELKSLNQTVSELILIRKIVERKKIQELCNSNIDSTDIDSVGKINFELENFSEYKIVEIIEAAKTISLLIDDLKVINNWVLKNTSEFPSGIFSSLESIEIIDDLIAKIQKCANEDRTNLAVIFDFLKFEDDLASFVDLFKRNALLKKTLDETFISAVYAEDENEVKSKLEDLQSANWFTSLFIGKHKQAKKWLKSILLSSKDSSYSSNAVDLNRLRQYFLFKKELEEKQIFQYLFEKRIELTTNNLERILNDLKSLLSIQSIYKRLSNTNELNEDLFSKIVSLERPSREIIDLTKKVEKIVSNFRFDTIDLKNLDASILKLLEKIKKIEFLKNWKKSNLVIGFKLRDLMEILEIAIQHNELKTRFDSVADVLQVLGFNFTDLEKLETELFSIISYSDKINGFELKPEAQKHFFDPRTIDLLNQVNIKIDEINSQRLEVFGICEELSIIRYDIERVGLVKFSESVDRAIANKDTLYEYENFIDLRESITSTIFENIVSKFGNLDIEPDSLKLLSEFAFYKTVLTNHLEQSNLLNYFDRGKHESIREKYRNLDREIIRLNRVEIAFELSRKHIPKGNSSGKKSTWTELALIEREIEKVQRHIPLRQLVKRSGNALQAIKPCFMMSPLTVAQFLPPGSIEFDLLVIDEASQIKPEDAVGAIARAKQVVVVGDTKQLPPTSFFDSTMDENDEIEENYESILEQAASTFRPARRLRWHYRSKHESLIAFSNSQFYDNDLILFPTARSNHADLGVKLRKIESGIYDGSGKNLIEAQAVLAAIKDHSLNHASKSLGVVTMNIAQKELIEDILFNECKVDPFLSKFVNNENGIVDHFFVKNLESVQGDEKDVIFISVTYGNDKDGAFYLRFGPINNKNGYRRLNVLFSRARERMEVFCSFEPGMIPTSSSIGANALRDFLEFAESGVLKTPILESARGFDSPFEKSVARSLERLGYQVKSQVGIAGYFVDIGVKNPNLPGEYILGIECDGATYHSSKSARDRDRLRQDNLEKLGWKIHRIWSTDWFRNERREVDLMVRKIESIIGAKSKFDGIKDKIIKLSDSVRSPELLRKDLVNLRDKINHEKPDVSSELGILRRSVLEKIISMKPKSESEFNNLLDKGEFEVDPNHLIYIPTILSILNESAG